MDNSTPGQVFTFYSYKGGTGRSMALANVACLLAEKVTDSQRVLIIDWDLEAPGLHHFFQERIRERNRVTWDSQLGLIDLFYEMQALSESTKFDEENSDAFFEGLEIEKYVLETEIKSLFLMTAGKFDSAYPTRVSRFGWESFFDKNPWIIPSLASYLEKQYRYVLIDSRTGFTDISSICTALMPERLVLVFTPNRQSINGVLDLVRQATAYRKQSNDLRPLIIFPLVSRVENAEEDLQRYWRSGNSNLGLLGYQPEFESVLKEVYDLSECDLTAYFNEVKIQHVPKYSYGEDIAVLSTNKEDRLSLAKSYENFMLRLIELDGPWEKLQKDVEAIENEISFVQSNLIDFVGSDLRSRRLRVFLSHTSVDKLLVRDLFQMLEVEGWIDPWFDEARLLPGMNWDLEIERAVDSADVVIVCLSSGSVTREAYIQRELRFVVDVATAKPEGTIFLIPLRLENCPIPRKLLAWQTVDYFPAERREEAFRKLLRSLSIRAESLGIQIRENEPNLEIEDQIREKISKNELEEALKLLAQIDRKKGALFSYEYNRARNDWVHGLTTKEQFETDVLKVIDRILDTLEESV